MSIFHIEGNKEDIPVQKHIEGMYEYFFYILGDSLVLEHVGLN
jgi:hypothetical protein